MTADRGQPANRLVVVAVLALAACQAAAPAPSPSPSARRTGTAQGAAGQDVPLPRQRAIAELQGRAPRSAFIGQQVSIQGVVVGNFVTGLHGVFVQSERADGDAHTAEGIFVEHTGSAEPRLHAGDRVRVSGRVAELGDGEDTLTAMRETVVTVLGRGSIVPVALARAPAQAADWERYEGMAVNITVPLTVSGNDGLAAYGELVVSFGGRLFQPGEIAAPGAAAAAVAADNARRRLLLDDNRTSKNPRDVWFLPHGLSEDQPLRAGSVLRNVAGVLDQRRGQYRLQLTGPVQVQQAPRPPAPAVAGDLRVASLNLLNLFNGDGRGGGFPTDRGADSREQYQRQQAKLVSVVQALAPDVAALMEVENDGAGPDSALAQFTAALNAAGPLHDFRFVDTGHGPGSDAIRVALIYRGSRVSAQGRAATLPGGPFAGRSRVPLAQAFRAGSGPPFVVAVNHFKSKGCGHDPDRAQGAQADQHDGQGCWNPIRVESARRLQAWLATDPTGAATPLAMIIGDLNAHALEDPLRVLHAGGWQDAFAAAGVERPYSFVFDAQAGRLDHALLSAPLVAHLRGALEWHNNSDESARFDYHDGHSSGPYRASDHDPILLGFDLRRAGTLTP